jgi:hypothetical protein
LARYGDYRADVGTPGAIEGAAGSSYIKVTVAIEGHLKGGSRFEEQATATLRRVNDVPGSSAEQRRWHITGVLVGSRVEE